MAFMKIVEKYNPDWFTKQKIGATTSAEVIVPMVMALLAPKSVVDIGCGVGAWLSIFLKNGVNDVLGIDGEWVRPEQLLIPLKNFKSVDINKPFNVGKRADLAVSLEVGEHLSEESSESLVQNLVESSNVVLFSAAIPHQPGTGHINGQWPEYWANIFKKYGYIAVDAIRRKVWTNPNVEYWYAQNIFIYVKESELANYPKLEKEVVCGYSSTLPLVHPERYRHALKPAPTITFRIIRKLKNIFGLKA